MIPKLGGPRNGRLPTIPLNLKESFDPSHMNWYNHQADILTLAQQGSATVAAVVATFALGRWRRELRGATRHETAMKVIKETFNIRSSIAVARRSWRTVFFTHDPEHLRNPANVAEYDRQAELEKSYWQNQLSIMESAGVNFRNEAIVAETIWKKRFLEAAEKHKSVVDEWTYAVTERIENLTKFIQTTQPEYLNSISWILVSDYHITERFFPGPDVEALVATSKDYWNRLEAECTHLAQIVRPGFRG